MKKLLGILVLGLLWCNVGFGADYLELPMIKELLNNKDNLHYACYFSNGKTAGTFRIDMKNRMVNEIHAFDKSSNKNSIKIYIIPPDSSESIVSIGFFTFNVVRQTLLLQELQNVDINDQKVRKLIDTKDLFKLLAKGATRSSEEKCATTLFFKLEEIVKSDLPELLNQAIKESSLPKCTGGDPLKWTNCVGRKGRYIGEFFDGDFHGQGIAIYLKEIGHWGDIYIGEFVEDYFEGQGTFVQSPWLAGAESPEKEYLRKYLVVSGTWELDKLIKAEGNLAQDKILGGKKTDLLFKCSSGGGNIYWGFNEVDFGSKKRWVIFDERLDDNADEIYGYAWDILTQSENGHMYWSYLMKVDLYDEQNTFYWFNTFRLELNNSDFKSSENNTFTMIELELGNTFSDVNEILINDKIYYALKELESSRIYFRSPSITKEKIETFKKNLETYSNELRNFEKDKFKAQAWKDYNKLQDEEAMKLAYENSVKFITNWKCGKIQ